MDAAPCRLLRHPPAAGAWNMGVDEMLLERAESQSVPSLRVYAWSEPTLSLGYFQDYADREQHPPSRSCAAVRRLTGGGAILHDRELTYSIVLPAAHALAARRDELYAGVHGGLIAALAAFGVTARLCGPHDEMASPAGCGVATLRQPFLCFQRRAPGDVAIGPTKICGSAQRRRNGAVLQHGSLLWQASPAAAELPGLADVAALPISLEQLGQAWLEILARQLHFAWQADELDAAELRQAETVAAARYRGDGWTKYRGRGVPRA